MSAPILAWLLLFAVLPMACGHSSPDAATIPRGSLGGRVVLTGLPSPSGLTVTLRGPVAGATTTDASGQYAFAGLPEGDYSVATAVPSTAEGSAEVVVHVATGATAAPDLVFSPLGSIDGGVIVLDAPPQEGLTVALVGPVTQAAVTDLVGKYAFKGIPVGDYVVTVSVPSTVQGAESKPVHVAMGTTTSQWFLFVPVGAILGNVVLDGIAPRPGFTVDLSGQGFASTATDDAGAYAFRGTGAGLARGDYTVTATVPSTVEKSKAVSVHLVMGDTAAPDLHFTPVGTLAGSVTLAGQPVAGVVVWLAGTSRATLTTSDGAYLLRDVPVGSYAVMGASLGYQTAGTATQGVAYAATTAVPPLDLAVADPAQPATGRLAGFASVAGLGRRSGITVSVDGGVLGAVTGQDGAWAIEGVEDGGHSLTVTDGTRVEHVPAVWVLSGQGYLLDELLYPIGELELQGALRVCHACGLPQLTRDRRLVVTDGSVLVSASLDGGPVVRLAGGVDQFLVPATIGPGVGSWVATVASDWTVRAVPAAGGAAVPVAVAGASPSFDPSGGVLYVEGQDGRLWYAALDRGDVRPVARGQHRWDVGPGHFSFVDPDTLEFGTVAHATGDVAVLATDVVQVQLLPGGQRIAVQTRGEPMAYGPVLVGPPGGPLTLVAPASTTLLNTIHSWSPDGLRLVVQTTDLTPTGGDGLLLVSTPDRKVIASERGQFLAWSPDYSHFTWQGDGMWVGAAADGSSVQVAPGLLALTLFSPDGRFLALAESVPEQARVVDTSTGATVVVSPPGAGFLAPLAFSLDSAFLLAGGLSLHSLPTGGGGATTLMTPSFVGILRLAPDGRRAVFLGNDGLYSAPLAGAPRTLLVPTAPSPVPVDILAPTDAVLVRTLDGHLYVPIEGGAVRDLGAYGQSWPEVSADGLTIAYLRPDGTVVAASLPGDPPVVVAAGIQGFRFVEAGLVLWDAAGNLDVAAGPAPATQVGTGVVSYAPAAGGRLLFSTSGNELHSVDVATAATSLLAGGLDEPGWVEGMVHGDRALFTMGGVFHSIPVAGGPLTPHARGEANLGVQWLDDRHAAAWRSGALPPYRFQNGLYLVTVP